MNISQDFTAHNVMSMPLGFPYS